jgi:hypothetical protein
MISVQVISPLIGGGTVTATVHGLAAERDDLIYEATDAVLMTRVRMNRITAPFATPVPMVAGRDQVDTMIAAYPCENPDPEGRVA